jgi:hypothetical protein
MDNRLYKSLLALVAHATSPVCPSPSLLLRSPACSSRSGGLAVVLGRCRAYPRTLWTTVLVTAMSQACAQWGRPPIGSTPAPTATPTRSPSAAATDPSSTAPVPQWGTPLRGAAPAIKPSVGGALPAAAAAIARTVGACAIACFTISGSTARRAARERADLPVLCLTPKLGTARRMGLVWGVHAVVTRDVSGFEEMVEKSKRMALRTRIAKGGDPLVLIAGVPFSTPGTTNVVHVVRLTGKELHGF